MCGGVEYLREEKKVRTYFPNPQALLPVLLKDGSLNFLPWGRRKEQPGQLPLGGWARLESIQSGRWDKYFPKPVLIPVLQFMEKDKNRKSHWFPVLKGQYIQGLLAHYENEVRVYVVTLVPKLENAIHDRWPKMVVKEYKNSHGSIM